MGAAAMAGSAGIQAAGGILSASAERTKGRADQDYLNYLAGQSEINATLAIATGERNSRDAQDKAALDTHRLAEEVAAYHGATKVALAASGVALNSVTAEDITVDTINKSSMDEMMIRYNADQKSQDAKANAEFEADSLRSDARLKRVAGNSARVAGNSAATMTLLSTAGQVAGSVGSASRYGAFSGLGKTVAVAGASGQAGKK